MKYLIPGFLIILLAYATYGKTMTKEIDYTLDSVVFKGFLAWDDQLQGKRPGILLVHEWWGLNDFIKGKARDLAAMGYIVFAADMYGNGRTTTDPQTAAKMAGEVRGMPRMRERAVAALALLKKQAGVESGRIAAMGFCFGGTAVLELAYSGAAISGIVTFHAGIISPKPEDLGNIKTKLLILHGADDPYVPVDSIARFQESLRKAHADWQMVYFGNAVHAFTNPANGSDNSKGLAYNPLAAQRSWRYMKDFLVEIFSASAGLRGQ